MVRAFIYIMKMRCHLSPLLYRALLCFSFAFVASCSYTFPGIIEKKTEKPFYTVIEDALFAITENNFKVTGHLKIGEAIRKNGNKQFPLYQNILFCNLGYTERMLSFDARFIYFCPYKISVREEKGNVIIGTVLLPENHGTNKNKKLAREINALLIHIVNYAAADKLPAVK